MAAITFDTLKFANRLKSAGVPPAQAEAEAEALAEVLEVNLEQGATRQDVALLRKEDLDLLRQEMEARFIQLEQRMTIKLGALMVAAVGSVAALVKIF